MRSTFDIAKLLKEFPRFSNLVPIPGAPWVFMPSYRGTHPWLDFIFIRQSGRNDDPKRHHEEIMPYARKGKLYFVLAERGKKPGDGDEIHYLLDRIRRGKKTTVTTNRVDRTAHDLDWGIRFAEFLRRKNFRLYVTNEWLSKNQRWPSRKPLTERAYLKILRRHNKMYLKKNAQHQKTIQANPPPKRGRTGYRTMPGTIEFHAPYHFKYSIVPIFDQWLKIAPLEVSPSIQTAKKIAAQLRKRHRQTPTRKSHNERTVLYHLRTHYNAYRVWKLFPERHGTKGFTVSL